MHFGKKWMTIAAMVPVRTKKECRCRWHDVFDPSVDPTHGRSSKWTAYEDVFLKDAVQRQGGNHWIAMCALMPGRTNKQVANRWHNILDPSEGRDAITLSHNELEGRKITNTSAAARYLHLHNNGVFVHSGNKKEAKAVSLP
jgi:hypothetical protein